MIMLLLLLVICLFVGNTVITKSFKRGIYKKEKLEENFSKAISFKGCKLQIKERLCPDTNSNAEDKKTDKDILYGFARIEDFYIPQEGGFVYKEYTDGKKSLSLDTCGLTFKPYGGIFFNSQKVFSPFIGARFFYYGSLGCGIIGAKNGLMLCADKRLDTLPFFNNTALLFGINKNTAAFGAAVFF